MATLTLVEGHTGVIDQTLKAAGTVVDLTGMFVDLVLQTANGTLLGTSADVTVPAPMAGLVRYSPDPGDLLARDTPHVARWKVTDAQGAVVFFPSEAGDVWIVQPTGVIPLQANALLTLAELKAYLLITGNEQDLTLASYINGVSDALETLTGRRLVSQTYTQEYRYITPETVIGTAWLDVESPITALSALSIGGTAQTVCLPGGPGSPDTYDVFVLEGRRDRLIRPAGWPLGALVSRTYTAGYSAAPPAAFPIPGDLKQALLTLSGDWYYRRSRQADPVISRSAGAETITYVNEALPRAFPTLLNGYRRWG
jgi:uncharacterized phiE125 gp8 family phage protein